MPALAAATRPAAAAQPASADTALAARLKSLPLPAQQKFERLRRAASRARALIDGLADEIERVRENLATAQRELGVFDRRHQVGSAFSYETDEKTGERKRVPAVFPERTPLLGHIEHCKAEVARLREDQAAANLGYNIDNITDWLVSQTTKFVAAASTPKLGKENLADALERNRQAQAAARDEIAAVENAPITIAEAKAAMRAEVAALIERGRPDVGPLFYGEAVAWPTEQFTAGGHGAHEYVVAATVKDSFAFAVWANRDAVIRALEAEIERMGDDTKALSADAQATRRTQTTSNLLRLQRQAEAIIETLEDQGHPVRRTCIDPEVLLGIEPARS